MRLIRWCREYGKQLAAIVSLATVGNVSQLVATWMIQGTVHSAGEALSGEPLAALSLHVAGGLGLGFAIWLAVAILADRDSRLKLREALNAVRRESSLKSKFLLETSHEFINPLAIAQGYARLLLEGREWASLTPVQQRALREVAAGLDRINGLLKDTLRIAEQQAAVVAGGRSLESKRGVVEAARV